MRLASTTMTLVILLAAAPAQTPARVKLRIRDDGGTVRATIEQAFDFDTPDAAMAWLREQAAKWSGAPDVTLGIDVAPDRVDIAEVYEKLRDAVPSRPTRLEVPRYHLEKIKDVGPYLDKEKILHFGNWLSAFYTKQFGDEAGEMMWADLHRALEEYRPYLAANLILSLPNLRDPKGRETWFADLPKGARLPADLLRQWMRMALDDDLGIETRRVFVDNLAKVNDRRAVAFCLHVARLEGEPLWLKGTGIRALLRIRNHRLIVTGQMISMALVPSDESEASQERHRKGLEASLAWWEKAKASYPEQVMPGEK